MNTALQLPGEPVSPRIMHVHGRMQRASALLADITALRDEDLDAAEHELQAARAVVTPTSGN